MEESEGRAKIIEVAKEYLNTPYVHAGRLKGMGVDCLTLLAEVYTEAGVIPPVAIPNYPYDWHLHRAEQLYMKGLLEYTREIQEPKAGDIVLWQFGRCFSHGAIVVEWPIIIHAYIKSRCIMENVENATWLKYMPDGKTPRPTRKFSIWG